MITPTTGAGAWDAYIFTIAAAAFFAASFGGVVRAFVKGRAKKTPAASVDETTDDAAPPIRVDRNREVDPVTAVVLKQLDLLNKRLTQAEDSERRMTREVDRLRREAADRENNLRDLLADALRYIRRLWRQIEATGQQPEPPPPSLDVT